MIFAVAAGLIVSGVLLLFAERKHREDFLVRSGLLAVAICGGGAILSVFLYGSLVLVDAREPVPRGLEILYNIAFPAVAGGVVGIIEAVSPSLPLAWLFGNRAAARSG